MWSVPVRPGDALWNAVAVLGTVVYCGLGLYGIITVPVSNSASINYINAPDEYAHLQVVRCISQFHRMPLQHDPLCKTYEWHQPPLYYLVVAPVLACGPLGVRLVTLLIGLTGLLATYFLASAVAPGDRSVAAVAVLAVALLPMRQLVYGSVGNDALVEVLSTLALVCAIIIVRTGWNAWRAVVLGLIIGLAILTKASAIILPALVPAILLVAPRGKSSWERSGQFAAIALCVSLIVVLPWLVRNQQQYGQILPLRAFAAEFAGTRQASGVMKDTGMSRGEYLVTVYALAARTAVAAYTPHPAIARDPHALPGRDLQHASFMARNGIPVLLPLVMYTPWILAGVAALAGLLLLHRRPIAGVAIEATCIRLCLLISALNAVSWTGFILTYFQAQGRYLYPSAAPLSVLIAVGLHAAIPSRYYKVAVLSVCSAAAAVDLFFVLVILPAAYS